MMIWNPIQIYRLKWLNITISNFFFNLLIIGEWNVPIISLILLPNILSTIFSYLQTGGIYCEISKNLSEF